MSQASEKFSESAWFDDEVHTRSSTPAVSNERVGKSLSKVRVLIVLWLTTAIMCIGFFLPFVSVVEGQRVTATAYQMAVAKAPQLWNIPLLSGVWIWLMLTRRAHHAWVRTWPSLLIVAVGSLLCIGYTAYKIMRGAAILAQRYQRHVELSAGVGAWMMVLAALVWILTAVRLAQSKPHELR